MRRRDVGTLFQALKRPAKQDIDDHARRMLGPDGPWPRRSVASAMKVDDRAGTVRISRRRRRSWRRGTKVTITTTKLVRARNILGRLPAATKYRVRAAGEIAAESPIEWAAAHNKGAKVGRGAVLPRRELYWWSDRFVDLARHAIETHIVAGWDPSIRLSRVRLSL